MDVSEFCNLCKKPNDQMLMLACVHDPCINCAATSYAEQVHIKGQNPDVTPTSYLDLRLRSLSRINCSRLQHHR